MSASPELPNEYPELDMKGQARFENLVNDAGFSVDGAYTAITGIRHNQQSALVSGQRDPVEPRPRRVSRRGGRGYPQPTDSALDPYWNPPFEPLEGEELEAQQQTNRQGREFADRILAPRDVERTRRDAEERGMPFEALLRARVARRERQRRNV